MTVWALATRSDTARFGEQVGGCLQPGHILALVGDLGAGKTTLVQAIACGMGVTSSVSSPTFGLIHEYPGPTPLFHFDTYRLSRAEDLVEIGFYEYFERRGVVIVEWADRFPELLPEDRLELHIDFDPDAPDTEGVEDIPRILEATATGSVHGRLLADLERNLGSGRLPAGSVT
jgi:tRNA threonylcarbamoyladenosine biosynthesis protein TsaE